MLVSTDKAVSPATVMGASKTLAEWAVEAAQHRFLRTRYATVRFGNVLGSSGSVVPIFRRQIAEGGPVTVTDAGMTRYFMTIPEAVQLIIRSGDLGKGGEVYVLEMGEPVKIVDLAQNMIRLAGLRSRTWTSRSRSSAGARARSSTRSCSTRTSGRSPRRPRRSSPRCARRSIRSGWRRHSARVEELVYNGDPARRWPRPSPRSHASARCSPRSAERAQAAAADS